MGSRSFVVVLAIVAAASCSEDQTKRHGSGSGGSSSSGTSSGGSMNGGGGAAPTASCEDYLACVAAATPGALGEALATYGENGSCWQELPDATCLQACADALADLHGAYPSEPACGEVVDCTASFDTPCETCGASACSAETQACIGQSTCDALGEPTAGCLALVQCATEKCGGFDLACIVSMCGDELGSCSGECQSVASNLGECVTTNCSAECGGTGGTGGV
jgi:hypothetical protein